MNVPVQDPPPIHGTRQSNWIGMTAVNDVYRRSRNGWHINGKVHSGWQGNKLSRGLAYGRLQVQILGYT